MRPSAKTTHWRARNGKKKFKQVIFNFLNRQTTLFSGQTPHFNIAGVGCEVGNPGSSDRKPPKGFHSFWRFFAFWGISDYLIVQNQVSS
jgi:hypothetical protein